MRKENEFWLIDSNFVGAIRFYKSDINKDKFCEYIFIEEGIVMSSHGENPPLMKTRRKMQIEDARFYWKILLQEGWQKTDPKW